MRNRIALFLAGFAVLSSLLVAAPAFAQGNNNDNDWGRHMGGPRGVYGTVTAISGDTLTVKSENFGPMHDDTAGTVYTVDASNARIVSTKNGPDTSIADIAVGDTVMVNGTISGTSVTAQIIHDGAVPAPMMNGEGGPWNSASSTPPHAPYFPQGNGEPVVGGTVSSISGSTFTLTTSAGTSYTVDASSADISVKGATSTVSGISTGDHVVVQGSFSGSSVAASSVIDSGTSPSIPTPDDGDKVPPVRMLGGFFGALGGFFHNLFGFF